MSLPNELITKLVTVMNDNDTKKTNNEPVQGTIVKMGDVNYVRLDGSNLLTPVNTAVDVDDGERVLVSILNHTATVTGNISSPAARKIIVDNVANEVVEATNSITVMNSTIKVIDDKVTSQGNTITQINNDIVTQNNTIQVMNNTIVSQGNRITQINDTITSQGNTITRIGDIVTSQGNQITQMGNSITSQGNQITMIRNDVTANNNKLTVVDNDIKEINDKIDSQNNTITQQGNSITEINDKIDSQNNTIVSQGNSITEINDKIDSQNNTITQYGNTINQHSNDITSINNVINTQGNTIAIINSSFEITDGVVTGIKGVDTEWIKVKDLEVDHGRITTLETNKANIDLANVNNAWIQNGIIKNGSIGETAIHDGAVTNAKIADATIEAAKIKSINADTITAGTIKTDRLVITGPDGQDSIVKAINIANGITEAEVNSKQIQAASIDVVDLSAFKARIASFDLDKNAIYSNKTSIKDPSSGIYISTTGLGIGNGLLTGKDESPIQMYADGTFKLEGKNSKFNFNAVTGDLELDVTKLSISSKTVATTDDIDEAKNENTTVLRVFSSKGTTFADSTIGTTFTVIIYKGNNIITDVTKLHEIIGEDSYLQWYYKKSSSDTWTTIPSTDSRVKNGGFLFDVIPASTDSMVDYRCELIDTPYTVFMLDQSELDNGALA